MAVLDANSVSIIFQKTITSKEMLEPSAEVVFKNSEGSLMDLTSEAIDPYSNL